MSGWPGSAISGARLRGTRLSGGCRHPGRLQTDFLETAGGTQFVRAAGSACMA